MKRFSGIACAAAHLTATGLLGTCLPALADTADSKGSVLEEIIVTAQKVAEPASRTPLALTAISGDALRTAGITDARGLTESAPSVVISQESRKLGINIRGVQTQDNNERGDPSTAFHIDGAYIGRPEAQLGSFYDLERVEVLRGPQGTLYGRNATAGAINVITAKPSAETKGRAGVELGDYGTVRTDAMVNLPITDGFWLRAAFNSNKHDSYIKPGDLNAGFKDMQTQDTVAGRVHGLFRFTEDTSLLLTLEGSRDTGGGNTPVPITNFFPTSPNGTNTAISGGNNIAGAGTTASHIVNPVYVDRGSAYQRTANAQFPIGVDNTAYVRGRSARAEFNTGLGFAALTYQFAFLDIDQNIKTAGTFFSSPFDGGNPGSSRQTSHELRLNSSNPGAFKWTTGLYHFQEAVDRNSYFHTHISSSFTFNLLYRPHVDSTSNAIFGQGTYSFTDTLRLTAGVRYTKDEKAARDAVGGENNFAPGTPYDTQVKFSKTTGKIGIEADVGSTMLYGAISTGYKAGGFNVTNPVTVFNPETLTSYEVGSKGRYLDSNLQLNSSVFYYDYKDLQLASVICPGGPETCNSQVANASKAKVSGAELEGKYVVLDNGLLSLSLSYVDAKYDRYPINKVVNNALTQVADFSNQQLDQAPKGIVSLSYAHNFELANGGTVTGQIGSRWSNSYYLSDAADGVRYQQPSFHKSEVRLGYTAPGKAWSAQLFAKNLENYITIESRVPGSFAIGDPRTFGARLTVEF